MKTDCQLDNLENEKLKQNSTGLLRTKSVIRNAKKNKKINEKEFVKLLRKNVTAMNIEERLRIINLLKSYPVGRLNNQKFKLLKLFKFLEYLGYIAIIGLYLYLSVMEYYL
ncbi:MAG: hypothetical protein KDK36_22065 [Leptospiraceae bacterium]|nr:hypothetical protein [Leptospiraceae bacterium]